MIAKYFATSLAMLNVVRAPRVISSCLPISTISISFVGLLSRSTMLPASLAADVPLFIATPTSAWAKRRGVVGPVAGHRDELAALLLLADERHLVLRCGLGEEVVDARLLRDRPRGHRVVAGDHHGADAHRSKLVEPLPHALLDDVAQGDDPEDPRGAVLRLGDQQRRTPEAEIPSTSPPVVAPARLHRARAPTATTELAAPLRTWAARCSPSRSTPGHPGLGGERSRS